MVQDGLLALRVVRHVAMPIQMVGGQVGAERDVKGWPGGLRCFVEPPRHRARTVPPPTCDPLVFGLTQVATACGWDPRRDQRRVGHGGGGALPALPVMAMVLRSMS